MKRSDRSRRLYLSLPIFLVRKRNGRYKARWVLRGDHQIFDEPDLDDDEDDWENNSQVSDDYNAEVTEEEDNAEVTDGDETEHDGVAQEATENDAVENDAVVDAFNTAFAGLSEKEEHIPTTNFTCVDDNALDVAIRDGHRERPNSVLGGCDRCFLVSAVAPGRGRICTTAETLRESS